MPKFAIYHGCCSGPDIDALVEVAPDTRHGHCWTPLKQTPHDNPWILDNGVYSAWRNDEDWTPDDWLATIETCLDKMPRPPDFAVLPDAVGDPEQTIARSRRHADAVPNAWPTAFAVQDGIDPERAVTVAQDLDCHYLFVGGTARWKRRAASAFVEATSDTDLAVHIARPSVPDGVLWARELGAVSVDTTSIVTSPEQRYMRRIAEQTTLQEAVQ
jgi:hypothetical protein